MKLLIVALTLATLTSACGRSTSTTSPTELLAGPRSTYSLSGVVFGATTTGRLPLQGARVEELKRHLGAMTDANGFYRISGLQAGSGLISVSKEGYQSLTKVVTVDGDARLDIELRQRSFDNTLSGFVSELTPAGEVAVEGAWLSEWSEFHAGAWSDKDGFYKMSGLEAGGTGVSVSKEGYQPVTAAVTIDGDTRLDIQLIRR